MAIDLTRCSYIPTIFLRNAELRALRELPNSDKDDLAPIFALKPWLTSKELMRSIEKIQESFGERDFFLDLDPFYRPNEIKRPAQDQFLELLDSSESYSNWMDFVEEHDRVQPCLRLEDADNRNIREQIESFTGLERTFLARIIFDHTPRPHEVVDSVCETEHGNFGFVLDVGWGSDILSREAWASGLVGRISDLRPEIPIVVSGSSFPSSFTGYEIGEPVHLDERTLYRSLSRRHNAASLIYGDWASSRKPSEQRGGAAPTPRIDLPDREAWRIFRIAEDNGGYVAAAREVLQSDSWNNDLDVWGTYMIRATAQREPFSINAPPYATAARINIHLHYQLRYNDPIRLIETEDEYQE